MKAPGISPTDAALVSRIVQEARKEFFSLGFNSVTMDDLAGKMGMSKKTLYKYFPGKEELLEAVIQAKLNEADGDLQAAVNVPGQNIKARLASGITCLLGHMQEIKPPFVRDMSRHAPELFQRVQVRRQSLIQRHIGKILEEGTRSGEIRGDIELRLVMEILFGTVNAVMTPSKVAEMDMNPGEVLSAIFTVLLEGLLKKGK
jgi:AcrR family transcriptional regulator